MFLTNLSNKKLIYIFYNIYIENYFEVKCSFSNNVIQDDGVRDILEGLINQINEDKDGKGLSILVLWNNQLTKKSSPYFARIIVCNFILSL